MKVYLNSFDEAFYVNLITKNFMFTLMDYDLPEIYNLEECLPRPESEKRINISPIAFFKAYKLLGGKLCKPQEF